MEITQINQFLRFYERTHEGTIKVLEVIPPAQMDWTYAPGKFTIADLVRHIAAIERNLFAELVQGHKINYRGCGRELADGHAQVMAYFSQMHQESVAIFKRIPDADLSGTITSAGGKPTTVGNFLRALVIHEVHHRGALCVYLNILGVKTPPIYGLTAEDLMEQSK